MNEELERIYSEALDLLEQGTSVEAILARYPGHAADLRPFLQTVAALSTLATQPNLTAEKQSKRNFLAAAATAATPATRRDRRPATAGWLSRLLAPALAALLLVFLGGATIIGASGAAVPGSALYETKRLVEEVRLNLATNPERAALLRERFRQERLSEIERLLAGGVAADVSLTGVVEAMAGENWTVDGVPVVVGAGAVVDGAPAVGTVVEVTGRTDGAVVRAARVVLLSGPLPAATTPAPAAATATPEPAPSATATPPPTREATATQTATSPATAPATSAPATLPPPPPATPGDDDNGNDNDEAPPTPPADDDNDNGGDDNDNEAPTPPPDDDNDNDDGGGDDGDNND